MKEKDRLYSLNCDLMALQGECNAVKAERDSYISKLSMALDVIARLEGELSRLESSEDNPLPNNQG